MVCRSRDSILNLLIFAFATGLSGCSEPSSVGSKTVEVAANEDVRSETASHQNAGTLQTSEIESGLKSASASNSETEPYVSAVSTDSGDLTDEDLARSSWENPFHPRLWSCENWQLGAHTMTCQSEPLHPATFLRPYRNIVIECQLTCPTGSAGTSASEPKQSSNQLEFRLVNQGTGNWAGLMIDADDVSLTEFVAARQPTLRTLRKCSHKFNNSEKSNHRRIDVRVTMTANRILVAIDGRLKINVTRPSAILGADCLARFIAHQPGTTLSQLRIEGE